MKLYDTGVYLLNGQKIVPENQEDFSLFQRGSCKEYNRRSNSESTILPKYGETPD